MIELLGKSLEELQSIFKTHNIQKFRAKQLIDYIYHRYVFDFQKMTQFPKKLRQWLSDNCVISLPTLITESISPDGKTRKILLEMPVIPLPCLHRIFLFRLMPSFCVPTVLI